MYSFPYIHVEIIYLPNIRASGAAKAHGKRKEVIIKHHKTLEDNSRALLQSLCKRIVI